MEEWEAFGAELRRFRVRAGLSVRQLARALHYDAGALSRFENGRRKPPPDIVRKLDRILDTNGALSASFESMVSDRSEADRSTQLHLREARALAERRYIDHGLANDLEGLLSETRRLEDQVGSKLVLPVTIRQTRVASLLAKEARGSARAEILDAAAGWKQFSGWLHANLGNHSTAVQHYRAALEQATESGNRDMASTALSMRGHVAWMAGEIDSLIGLSRAAQRDGTELSPTVLALAVQQEARGLAIQGDLDAMELKLDQAAELIARGDPDRPDAQYFYSDSLIDMQRGLAYRLARQWDKAVVSLERGLAGFDPDILTSEWATWYVAELGCALAGAGEPEAASRAATEALRVGAATPGSRLVKFIRTLHREMSLRWGANHAVAALGEELRQSSRKPARKS
ncbi:helix-turn-helix domain-containing protein [Nocardia sp. CDC159]|uniref:Helix-turn-helix domain-containing protein n=1 Tax=Nocardia pulmonis TaxID=2951408 RepID=A0A9X2E328_9NOCA|nr:MULTISPECIES: helix-turn-helix transcriptional regulator [Nocardia]MCM6772760.1 helix-turn-helix domain-containing protein [Nocardia pulmonis]MCM6785937.1 helix-turn-helix domain-containing protein [Nocardia sp. CDC159]